MQKNPYLSIDLCGGLGNQMFQIMAVLSFAKKYEYEPIFERITASPSVFHPRPVYWHSIFRSIAIPTQKTEYYQKILFTHTIQEPGPGHHPSIEAQLKEYRQNHALGNVKLCGYYQSPLYFHDSLSLLSVFCLPLTVSLPDHTHLVSVHVRRGDYLKLQNFHIVLPISYYEKAAACFDGSKSFFIIFSDDPKWCTDHLLNNQKVFARGCVVGEESGDDVQQLGMMMQCKGGHIIANSSYSWWGAVLSGDKNRLVIAPSSWFVPFGENQAITSTLAASPNWRFLPIA